MMVLYHLTAVTLAYLFDLLIGDLPTWPHTVKWMGTGIAKLESKLNHGSNKQQKGLLMLSVILFAVLVFSFVLVYAAYSLHVWAGILMEACIITSTIAQKSLRQAGQSVYRPLIQGDLIEARLKLSYIVGRDTDRLGEGEITRGTVETVAENTSDGITAPLFWGAIGGARLP